MQSQRVQVKSPDANSSKVLKLKKIKSAADLLNPTTNFNDRDQGQKVSEKESSLKSIHSIHRSRLSNQLKAQSTTTKKYILFDELKELMVNHILQNAKKITQIASKAEKTAIDEKTSRTKSINQWREYLQNYFQCQALITDVLIRHQRNIYRYTTNSNQKRMILVSGQMRQAKSKLKKYEVCEEEKDTLKKQLAKYKTKVSELEKRVLKLVQEHRQRKQIYIKEIEKLTKIVNVSIKQIPELFVSQNKSPKHTNSNQKEIAITISPQYRIPQRQEPEFNDRMHLYFSNVSSISNFHNPENKEEGLVSKLPAFSTIPS